MKAQRPYLYDAVYRWILDNCWTPYLLVDATAKDAVVPQSFVQDGKIVLNVSVDALNNFVQDDQGISFSARFSGKSENLFVPFSAMIALYAKENAQGLVFPYENIFENSSENPKTEKIAESESSEKPRASKTEKPSLKIIK